MERDYLIKPVLGAKYPVASHGKGIYIYDIDGNEYIDGASGAVTASIGHGVQEVMDAMVEQAQKISFSYRGQFTSEPAEKLAKKLSDLAPGDLNWSFFVNSGSEATETAMKIAIQHWNEKGLPQKKRIISRWIGYHGITIGALSMSGHVLRRRGFNSLLADYPTISAPYSYRRPEGMTEEEWGIACADELETAIQRFGADTVAAFIAEPIVGASGGAITPPPGYYERIREICDRYDVLFIADEVMTGIGRTGKMFAMEHWDAIPDLITLGKGMSAGYTPIAATIVSDRVMAPIVNGSKSVLGGHTYSANPQSAAVSLKVLEYVEKHQLVQKAEEQGQYLFEKLKDLYNTYEIIGDVRGKGLLLGMEFVSDRAQKTSFPSQLNITGRIIERAFKKGLIVYPAAGAINGEGDSIIISPPLIITKAEINRLVGILEEAISEVQYELTQTGGKTDAVPV
ncbi:aspartate aminotransferase family protein [Bacillus salipaludis]|uniref:Aspartate aminotransferase family protein n=1 Tax=Bacillus salipaludis TaxID=2547811 RepID=A0A4R5VZZ3_9BACI|nr:aspartate aminotransferase family protein [Bacillus salipaludis]MDQ6596695.1 aspartate aminotransferase family protein [Bacillus salipaludis]TDK65079.1 aspartate aminotransferase family protein [Bacillus salipaludis]